MGIPAVARVANAMKRIPPGEELLVDGTGGTVVVAPAPIARDAFEEKSRHERARARSIKLRCREPAVTRDGIEVKVMANISCMEDTALAAEHGMDGIGLYRMEHAYLGRKAPPSEDELLNVLNESLALVKEKPVFVRLLDLGGDKNLPFLDLPEEPNPFLGRRGVRILLDFPNLLNTQLRALLRLSMERNVHIMIPMVTLASEVGRMRTLLRSAAKEVGTALIPPLGTMIETPAAALCARDLARHSDFFSMGTNDLTQYTMAAGRENASVADYFIDDHRSVRRLLEICAQDASGVPLSICGELAAREELVPYLVGLGFRTLSVPPAAIPTIKRAVRIMEIASKDDPGEWPPLAPDNPAREGFYGTEPMLLT
jgi:phosphoenolpyruvate-protein kinase (PTS system EI component)